MLILPQVVRWFLQKLDYGIQCTFFVDRHNWNTLVWTVWVNCKLLRKKVKVLPSRNRNKHWTTARKSKRGRRGRRRKEKKTYCINFYVYLSDPLIFSLFPGLQASEWEQGARGKARSIMDCHESRMKHQRSCILYCVYNSCSFVITGCEIRKLLWTIFAFVKTCTMSNSNGPS